MAETGALFKNRQACRRSASRHSQRLHCRGRDANDDPRRWLVAVSSQQRCARCKRLSALRAGSVEDSKRLGDPGGSPAQEILLVLRLEGQHVPARGRAGCGNPDRAAAKVLLQPSVPPAHRPRNRHRYVAQNSGLSCSRCSAARRTQTKKHPVHEQMASYPKGT